MEYIIIDKGNRFTGADSLAVQLGMRTFKNVKNETNLFALIRIQRGKLNRPGLFKCIQDDDVNAGT